MILCADSAFTAWPCIAYAIREGVRLLYSDPVYRAYLAGRVSAPCTQDGTVPVTVAVRACPFSVGGRRLVLSLYLLTACHAAGRIADGVPASLAPAEESALAEAENRFYLLLHRIREEEKRPYDRVLLPHVLAVLREQLEAEGIRHVHFSSSGERGHLPVCVRQGSLFLALGLAVGSLGCFGEVVLSFERGEAEDVLCVSLPDAVADGAPLCLLSEMARVGGFACTVDGRMLRFSMPHATVHAVLRDADDGVAAFFACGARALVTPHRESFF